MQTFENIEFNDSFHNLTEDTTFINCKFIGIHGDGVVCNGATVIFKNCVFDNTGVAPEDSDEAITLICGALVTVENCYFKHWGKGILVSNGDWAPEIENKNYLECRNTVFEECGRRHPYIRYGCADITNCVFKNFAQPGTYELKGNGIHIGVGASVTVTNCSFVQDKFRFSFTELKNQFDSVEMWNLDKNSKTFYFQVIKNIVLHPLQTIKQFRPGVCRGIFIESTGTVTIDNCTKNKWYIKLDEEI